MGVGELLVWQLNGKADRLAAGLAGAAIGGFHDARSASGAHHKAARLGPECGRPGSNFVRQLASFFIVARHFERASCAAQCGAVLEARSKCRATMKKLRSEEHTSELQSPDHIVWRLLLDKKKT